LLDYTQKMQGSVLRRRSDHDFGTRTGRPPPSRHGPLRRVLHDGYRVGCRKRLLEPFVEQFVQAPARCAVRCTGLRRVSNRCSRPAMMIQPNHGYLLRHALDRGDVPVRERDQTPQ